MLYMPYNVESLPIKHLLHLHLLGMSQHCKKKTISYISCLRLAPSWSRPRPPASLGGHTGGRGRLQWCHPQTSDVTILSSYFPSANVLWCTPSILYVQTSALTRSAIVWLPFRFSHLFSLEGDTRFYRATQDLVSPFGLEQCNTMLSIFALSQWNVSIGPCNSPIGW